MGNQLSGQVPHQIHPVEHYLSELSNAELITFDCNMGSTRFFKVARIKVHQTRTNLGGGYDNNQTRLTSHLEINTMGSKSTAYSSFEPELPALGVAKVFVINDPSLPLRTHKDKIEQLDNRLRTLGNCLTYRRLVLNDRVAVLMRQFIKYNLYDRLSTRPFLSFYEKKWIAFQLMRCLESVHSLGITHGDIKLENILITSSGWLLVTDFASYKPTYLPEDNPADFSYFFDTSRRRVCNVAPERFVGENFFVEPLDTFAGQLSNGEHSKEVTPEMDLFSLGCVLSEMFAESCLFDLATLLSYRSLRKGSSDKLNELDEQTASKDQARIYKLLGSIECEHIQKVIFNLIDLCPEKRKSCNEHIEQLMEHGVFPKYFDYVHKYLSEFNSLSADEKVLRLSTDFDKLIQTMLSESCAGLLLLVNSILPCMRSLRHVYAKLQAANLLVRICTANTDSQLSNSLVLERVLPYLVDTIAKETDSKVKTHCIKCLTDILNQLKFVPNSEKNVFPDFILPVLCKAVSDESALVRMQIARDLPMLSLIAIRYLNTYNVTAPEETSLRKENSNGDGNESTSPKSNSEEVKEPVKKMTANCDDFITNYTNFTNYASELKALQSAFQYITYCVLTDREISIRIELMLNPHLVQLCTFFGKQKTNEIIFSHLITFLNERSDFELRSAFFQCIIPIACYLGIQSSPLLKPLLQQGYTDPEESVINQALLTTARLTELQLVPKTTTLELLQEAIPLIVHPNLWIRHSLVRLIICCCGQLTLAELNCKLLPLIKPFLNATQQKNLLFLSNTVADTCLLLDNVVNPIPRALFDLLTHKVASLQNLEQFFESLEKRRMMRITYFAIGRTPNASSMSVASHSSSNLLNLNVNNLANQANNRELTSSAVSLSNNLYCCPPSLQPFFELLLEEGLTEEVELHLLPMADLIKRIYRQIKSTRSVLIHGQGKSTARSPLGKVSGFNVMMEECSEIKRKNKRLFSVSLNELASKLPQENEWHITSTMSGDSCIDEQLNQGCTDSFEIAKEAKEMSEPDFLVGEMITEELTPQELRALDNRLPSIISADTISDNDKLMCPPCVSQLNALVQHKQRRYGDALGGGVSDSNFCSSLASNMTLPSSTQQSSTVTESLNRSRYLHYSGGKHTASSYRPQGKLLTNLQEHRAAITRVVSIDCEPNLFATCSHDGSVRIWDVSKMNAGNTLVNKSKQVFQPSANESTESIAFGGMVWASGPGCLITYTDTSDVHVLRVDPHSSKMRVYQKINALSDICTSSSEDDQIKSVITDMSCASAHVFTCSFSNSQVCAFDLRMPLSKFVWRLCMQPNEGLITCITEGENAVFAGTSYGKIATFDIRFNLRSNTMSYNYQKRIRRLLFTPQGLYASLQGYNEISLWDCESGSRLKTLWASNAPPLTNKISNNSVHGLVACNFNHGEFGSLITCSSDARIRYWDVANPHRSYIMVDNAYKSLNSFSMPTGPATTAYGTSPGGTANTNATGGAAVSQVSYISKFMEGMQVIQEYHLQEEPQTTTPQSPKDQYAPPSSYIHGHSGNWDPQGISPSHKDTITDICWLNGCNLLASGARDGCVKIWK